MTLEEYRDLAARWGDSQAQPKVANVYYDQLHELYKRMRDTAEGRSEITRLMDDESVPVRLMAAVHSLRMDPARAEDVLKRIEGDPASALFGTTAKYTLVAFHQGRLNLDW